MTARFKGEYSHLNGHGIQLQKPVFDCNDFGPPVLKQERRSVVGIDASGTRALDENALEPPSSITTGKLGRSIRPSSTKFDMEGRMCYSWDDDITQPPLMSQNCQISRLNSVLSKKDLVSECYPAPPSSVTTTDMAEYRATGCVASPTTASESGESETAADHQPTATTVQNFQTSTALPDLIEMSLGGSSSRGSSPHSLVYELCDPRLLPGESNGDDGLLQHANPVLSTVPIATAIALDNTNSAAIFSAGPGHHPPAPEYGNSMIEQYQPGSFETGAVRVAAVEVKQPVLRLTPSKLPQRIPQQTWKVARKGDNIRLDKDWPEMADRTNVTQKNPRSSRPLIRSNQCQ